MIKYQKRQNGHPIMLKQFTVGGPTSLLFLETCGHKKQNTHVNLKSSFMSYSDVFAKWLKKVIKNTLSDLISLGTYYQMSC